MNRRQLLATVGIGATAFAGCLSEEFAGDDAGNTTGVDDTTPNSTADGESNEIDGSEETDETDTELADPPADAPVGDCPESDTELEPPANDSNESVESFVKQFEAELLMAPVGDDADRSVRTDLMTRVREEGRVRLDAHVTFGGSRWSGDVTIRLLEDEVNAEELERISTSADSIAETEPLLETIETVVETGESRSIDEHVLLRELMAAGEYMDDFVLEHDETLLYVENDALVAESHGERAVGYFVTDETVYRVRHSNEAWREFLETLDGKSGSDAPFDDPIQVDDDEWKRLECWS